MCGAVLCANRPTVLSLRLCCTGVLFCAHVHCWGSSVFYPVFYSAVLQYVVLVLCCALPYSISLCSTLQSFTLWCSAVLWLFCIICVCVLFCSRLICDAVLCSSVFYYLVFYSAVVCSVVQCCALLYSIILCPNLQSFDLWCSAVLFCILLFCVLYCCSRLCSVLRCLCYSVFFYFVSYSAVV